jgi:hypothetical protein
MVGLLCLRMSNLTKTPVAWVFFLVGLWFVVSAILAKVFETI